MEINWAHVHLMINHVPVIGLSGTLLLLIYALVRQSEEVMMASFGALVLIALMTIAVFFTGQAAEDVVKNIPGVTESYIGRHEESADLSLTGIEVSGALALVGLFSRHRKGSIPKWNVFAVLVTLCLSAGLVLYTANLGGEIRHTEIRSTASVVQTHDH
jgi:uncharacterized membrane protein